MGKFLVTMEVEAATPFDVPRALKNKVDGLRSFEMLEHITAVDPLDVEAQLSMERAKELLS